MTTQAPTWKIETMSIAGGGLHVARAGAGAPLLVLHHDIGTPERLPFYDALARDFTVLSSICPHLGCTVPWNSGRKAFVCPCHGASFSLDGSRIDGPSLRGMDALESSVEDGQLLVRFQYFRQLVADKEVIG